MRNDPSWSSKVVDFGTNRKRVCDFLLVINSNFGPILPHVRDIAGFLLRRATPSLFHPNFGGVLLELDYRCCGSEEQDPRSIQLFVNYFRTSRNYMPTVHQLYSQIKDGRTDGRTTYDTNIALALRASRGKRATRFRNSVQSCLGLLRFN